MLLVTVYMSVWFMCFGALRLQSRQQQNACNKKQNKKHTQNGKNEKRT